MLNQNFLIKLAAINCPENIVLPTQPQDWEGKSFTFYEDRNRTVLEKDMLAVDGEECLIWINDNPDILNGGKGLTAVAVVQNVNTRAKSFELEGVSLLPTSLGSTFLAEFSPESSVIEYLHTHRRKCIHRMDTEALNKINFELNRRISTIESGKINYEGTTDHSELFERSMNLAGWIAMQSPPLGNKKPQTTDSFVTKYIRLPEVVAYAKKRANGICELCKKHAPFQSKHAPFLEVHHVKTLAEGGTDTVTNAVAICPNCHRALHHSDKKVELLESLYEKNKFLIRE